MKTQDKIAIFVVLPLGLVALIVMILLHQRNQVQRTTEQPRIGMDGPPPSVEQIVPKYVASSENWKVMFCGLHKAAIEPGDDANPLGVGRITDDSGADHLAIVLKLVAVKSLSRPTLVFGNMKVSINDAPIVHNKPEFCLPKSYMKDSHKITGAIGVRMTELPEGHESYWIIFLENPTPAPSVGTQITINVYEFADIGDFQFTCQAP